MEQILSQVNLNDDAVRADRAAMEAVLTKYRRRIHSAMAGGGSEAVAKHKKRGKMLARERIEGLLDAADPPFLEFSALACARECTTTKPPQRGSSPAWAKSMGASA